MTEPRIGVLALQGAYAAHRRALAPLVGAVPEVRRPEQLAGLDGLALPGGESTTMLKFIQQEGFEQPLRDFAAHGGFLATCAGAILLARQVSNPAQPTLGLVDLDVRRNAYGRQLDSTILPVSAPALGPAPLEAVFIRAPRIERVGPGVEVLARRDGDPILVRQGKHVVATFHPELGADDRVHRLFVDGLRGGRPA